MIHYYLLFDGPDDLWQHTKTLYKKDSTFRYSHCPIFSYDFHKVKVRFGSFTKRDSNILATDVRPYEI